jgi:hypothetical protein
MKIPCTFKLRDNGQADVTGFIIGVSSPMYDGMCHTHYPCVGDKTIHTEYTTDAMVVLTTFDYGSVYQVPWHRIKIDRSFIEGEVQS